MLGLNEATRVKCFTEFLAYNEQLILAIIITN